MAYMSSGSRKVRRYLAAVAVAGMATSARAEVVATCAASTGTSYILSGGLVDQAQSGWVEDGISGGGIQLVRSGDEYDIFISDASGSTFSARADGASVLLIGDPPEGPIILAVYSKASEVYQFRLDQKVVVWTQAKFSGMVDKGSLFVAQCD